MTYRELIENKHYLTYKTNDGDNLIKIAGIIYDDTSKIAIQAILNFNNRFDWDYLPPGEEIRYLPKDLLTAVEQ